MVVSVVGRNKRKPRTDARQKSMELVLAIANNATKSVLDREEGRRRGKGRRKEF